MGSSFFTDLALFLNNGDHFLGKVALIAFRSAAVGVAAIGVFFILSAFVPTTLHTKKTKNTVGVNPLMFLLHGLVGFFFLLGAILLIVGGFGGKKEWDVPLTGFIFTICNLFGMTGSCYILFLKMKHRKAAQSLGITEYEYHKKYVEEDDQSVGSEVELSQ